MSLLADQLVLVPRPRHLDALGLGPAVDRCPVATAVDPGLPAEGFTLTTSAVEGARITHADAAGRRHALALLDQLLAQPIDGRVVAVHVEDHPDLATRAYLLDVSRDRVPTRATLERFVGLLALARYNQFQLYVEHTFAHVGHDVVWARASPITADDLRWLDDACTAVGIELVVNRNAFGHQERWLRHDAYRHRAECPDGVEVMAGLSLPPSVLAPTPENAEFALGLVREQLAEVRSPKVNIGCDETFELGRCASAAAVAERGAGAVYLEHLRRLVDPLVAEGREVQVWADVLRRHPHLAADLPDGVVPVAWCYEAPRPASEQPELPAFQVEILEGLGIDLDTSGGFGPNVAPLAEAGIPFWVAPGTSAWNSLAGRLDNARDNQLDAARTARRHGSTGYLVTDWGDNGHHQPPSISFGPLLHGGAVAWCAEANAALDLTAVLDRHAFGLRADAADGGSLGAALDVLGHLWNRTGRRSSNASPLAAALFPFHTLFTSGIADPEAVGVLLDEVDGAVAEVGRSRPTCVDGAEVVAEVAHAAELCRHALWRLQGPGAPSATDQRDHLRRLVQDQRSTWRARARPGGMVDSLGHLERQLGSTSDG